MIETSKTKLRKQTANLLKRKNVAKIFNALKESLDEITSFVKVSVKSVFHLEVGFIRNADLHSVFFKIIMNELVRISFVGKNFFALKLYPRKKFKILY